MYLSIPIWHLEHAETMSFIYRKNKVWVDIICIFVDLFLVKLRKDQAKESYIYVGLRNTVSLA